MMLQREERRERREGEREREAELCASAEILHNYL